MLQFCQFAEHTVEHWPPEHTGVAWGADGHALPQTPQLAGSKLVIVQAPAQLEVPDGHTSAQAPPAHT